MNALERVLEVQKQNLFPRLGKGAGILGELYREGQRCLSGWSRICPCPEPTGFGLVEEYYGGMPFGLSGYEPFYVIEAMTVSQFRQSGLTATVEVPYSTVRTTIRVGSQGTTWKTLVDLADLQDDDAALAVGVDAVVKLQKAEFRK